MNDELYNTITIFLEWINPDGIRWLQEWTAIIENGEQQTVTKAIDYLTSSERLEGRTLRSVRAIKTDKMDKYLFDRIDQPLYAVRGYEVNA